MAEKPTVVFMGTSPFAANILGELVDGGYAPAAVYTQPDRPAGRGMAVKCSAVKELALKRGLPVRQPENFKDEAQQQMLAALRPDFLLVAAYGLILPQAVLNIPSVAPVNVHGSLLPRYRGAAPIQRAIMENWQGETGVSIMRMVRKMDAGPVYATASVPIDGRNTEELTQALAQCGAELLLKTLPLIAAGQLKPKEQDEIQASYAPKLSKEEGIVDWRKPVAAVDAQVRAVTPWPGAQGILAIGDSKTPFTLIKGEVTGEMAAPPGTVILDKYGLKVACGDCYYRVLQLKPKGRRAMAARDFVNGLHVPSETKGNMV